MKASLKRSIKYSMIRGGYVPTAPDSEKRVIPVFGSWIVGTLTVKALLARPLWRRVEGGEDLLTGHWGLCQDRVWL